MEINRAQFTTRVIKKQTINIWCKIRIKKSSNVPLNTNKREQKAN